MNTETNITQYTGNATNIPVIPRGFKIRAFADAIGVSHTTVYNVLNGENNRVSEETRNMIIEKLKEAIDAPAEARA